MNAKKIMGAVLVALLAAALFVGAGAAAAEETSLGTVFVYQNTSYTGSWTGTAGTVEFVNGVIEALPAPGYYSNGSAKIYVTYPTAVISAVANVSGDYYYNVIGNNLYVVDDLNVTISIEAPAAVTVHDVLIIYPNGFKQSAFEALGLATAYPLVYAETGTNFLNGTAKFTLNKTLLEKVLDDQTGEFKLQALFAKLGQKNAEGALIINDAYKAVAGDHQLVAFTPDQYLFAQDVYSFTVADMDDEVTISASVDKVLEGKTFTVTVTGVPGTTYTLAAEDGSIAIKSAGGYVINISNKNFQMPSSGSITIYMTATATDDEVTIKVADTDAKVTVEILEPTLTATLDASSYFIGNTIKVILSSESGIASSYKFNITGTNVKNEIEFDGGSLISSVKEDGQTFFKLETADLKNDGKKLDVGTYTIKVYDNNNQLVATVPVVLKQPFITIVEAPEVVVQGKKAEFIINAEATDAIQYYVFGTNYFIAAETNKTVDKDTKNQFVVKLNESVTSAENMSTGQYFAVFQHKMYDNMFNIYAKDMNIVLNETGKTNTTLFNISARQTANAAQALCDALDSQNIDDMYVKASFFVVGKDESFTISEIPTTIAQGETLTISGISTANAGNTVTVEMISTAFAAVPKETVGSAAFIAVSTKVADDGTWEITMDTSDLNVDEYSLKVAVTADGKSSTWKNVNINVVEAADEPVTPDTPDTPVTPDTPDEPVAPATPGFGALAALAGLGAVAVLLLRRE